MLVNVAYPFCSVVRGVRFAMGNPLDRGMAVQPRKSRRRIGRVREAFTARVNLSLTEARHE
jgi:hypothetical protein